MGEQFLGQAWIVQRRMAGNEDGPDKARGGDGRVFPIGRELLVVGLGGRTVDMGIGLLEGLKKPRAGGMTAGAVGRLPEIVPIFAEGRQIRVIVGGDTGFYDGVVDDGRRVLDDLLRVGDVVEQAVAVEVVEVSKRGEPVQLRFYVQLFGGQAEALPQKGHQFGAGVCRQDVAAAMQVEERVFAAAGPYLKNAFAAQVKAQMVKMFEPSDGVALVGAGQEDVIYLPLAQDSEGLAGLAERSHYHRFLSVLAGYWLSYGLVTAAL